MSWSMADGKVKGYIYLYFAPSTNKKFKGSVRVVEIER